MFLRKMILPAVIVSLISGCSTVTPENQAKISYFQQQYESAITVDQEYGILINGAESGMVGKDNADNVKKALNDFVASGGEISPSFKAGLIDQCYSKGIPGSIYCTANNIDSYISDFKFQQEEKRLSEERQRKEQAKIAACNARPDCRREKAISNASDSLNQQYQMVLAMNPYDQGDFDGAIRKVCRVAGESQRQGVSLDTMRENMRLAEGIDPQTRYAAILVATACWILSENGVSDGTTKIRLPY